MGKITRIKFINTVFHIFNYCLMSVICCTMLYPFLYMFMASISDPIQVMKNKIVLIPKGITFHAYKMIFTTLNIGQGFKNSTIYTVVGTAINLFFTSITAYAMARKELAFRRFFTKAITFTMFFGGGLIPSYILVKNLNMIDSIWALTIPGAISTWNLLVLRSFFSQIPESLMESAKIDGANEMHILYKIIFPLSLPALATIGLFYAVGHWNSFFSALIFLNSSEKYPLQLMIRYIAIEGGTSDVLQNFNDIIWFQNIRYSVMIVSTLPIIMIYPFVQKFFASGVMIGALKG